jgi:hypothetical protein
VRSDAFGLIAVEERVGRAAFENCLQFPSKIDRVANAGVHALSTGRAVDVGRVAEQEGSTFPKAFCHAVMDAIGRKPIYLFYFDLEIVDNARADVLELGPSEGGEAYGTFKPDLVDDESNMSVEGTRKFPQSFSTSSPHSSSDCHRRTHVRPHRAGAAVAATTAWRKGAFTCCGRGLLYRLVRFPDFP